MGQWRFNDGIWTKSTGTALSLLVTHYFCSRFLFKNYIYFKLTLPLYINYQRSELLLKLQLETNSDAFTEDVAIERGIAALASDIGFWDFGFWDVNSFLSNDHFISLFRCAFIGFISQLASFVVFYFKAFWNSIKTKYMTKQKCIFLLTALNICLPCYWFCNKVSIYFDLTGIL